MTYDDRRPDRVISVPASGLALSLTLFLAATTAYGQANPVAGEAACAAAVQDTIAWDYRGSKHWAQGNIDRLCAGAEDSTEPASCFDHVMHGGVDWGGGTQWQWKNALELCRGTGDADATVRCFERKVAAGQPWAEAISQCQWRTPGSDETETPGEGPVGPGPIVVDPFPYDPGPIVTPRPLSLQGWVDLHTHPMSHLGFGRKAMHGAPDLEMILPAGTRDCNERELRARTMAQALGDCNSTHGGWGTDNTCGDSLRAAIISLALDSDFRGNVGFDRNLHGDHEHAGHPAFRCWPHHSSVLHQQMWWEWLDRARDGGLRVIVALTVNSETLAELINGDPPFDDKRVADVQIDETIRFVGRHPELMEIAYSAADVRRIATSGRLAVVLGMEVDKIGNFGKPGVRTDEAAVRAEIQRLYRKGVRYMFPIHLIDNAFGGTAVYEMLFNFANKNQNGYHYRVATDRSIGYNASLSEGPLGSENALIFGLHGALRGIGELPAPCFNDAIKCSPPPGKVRCCGSYEKAMDILKPSPELDVYKTIPGGHVNSLGLTRLGEVAITEMMRLGIIIDVDHMSERSLRSTLELARANRYPLVMGHNGVRPRGGNERGAPPDVLGEILASGGMLGLGTADAAPAQMIESFQAVEGLEIRGGLPRGAVGLGTDVNGFEPLPNNGRDREVGCEEDREIPEDLVRQSDAFYRSFFAESGIRNRSAKPSGESFDYIVDGGVSHYGLMPELLFDLRSNWEGGRAVYDELMGSAAYFASMWETIEERAGEVTPAPRGGTHSYDLGSLSNLCPATHVAGDGDFGGNGPAINGSVTLGISADGTSLQATVSFRARETRSDWSEVRGEWVMPVGDPAPAGLRYSGIASATRSSFSATLEGGGRNEAFEGCDGDEHVISPGAGPVSRLVLVGDTGGGDISGDADCHCDTRIVRIEFAPVDVTLTPR